MWVCVLGRLCDTGDYVDYMSQNCKKSCAGAKVGTSAAALGPDKSDNCGLWAKQGLCDTGDYVEYMSLNCKKSCADGGASAAVGAAAGDSSGALEPNPQNCAMWVRQGLCTGDYAQYMDMNCADQCAIADQLIAEALPPPTGIMVWLFVAGFFYAIYRAGKSALEQDANRSSSLSSSWQKVGAKIGDQPANLTIGSGKVNQFKSTKRSKGDKKSR